MLSMCLLCVAALRASVTIGYTGENPQLNRHGHQWNRKMSGNHTSRKGECRCASTFTAYAYISTFTVLRYFNWCEVEVTFCQKVTWKQKDRHNLGEICVERSSNHLGRQGKERSPPWKSLMLKIEKVWTSQQRALKLLWPKIQCPFPCGNAVHQKGSN